MGTKYNPSVVRNGLLMYLDPANYRSYSGSGITVNGLIGGIGATLVNGVGFGVTNVGNFNFDGTNDYISAPDISSLNLTNDLTAIVWFQITTFPGNDWVRVIGKGDGSNRTFGFWYYSGSPNYFLYQRFGTINVSIQNSTTLQLNTWYQGAVTSSGSTHRLYINGLEIGNSTVSSSFVSSSSLLKLGYGEIHSYHNGQISQAFIYDRGLTAQEILQNYNATKKRYL